MTSNISSLEQTEPPRPKIDGEGLAESERQREIETYIQSLARSNSDLKQFAFAASHDLQEPIRNVVLFTQLLVQSWNSADRARGDQCAKHVLDGARKIQDLVEGLRLYWEMSERELENARVVDARVVLERSLKKLAPALESVGGSARYDDLPVLISGEGELAIVFDELFDNAVKFRSQRPLEISIAAERVDTNWQISVRDNGIGIGRAYLTRIFGIFKRLSREHPGIGMGLPIAQKMVERRGGHIWAESAEGQGSTFFFTWPGADTP